MVVSFAPAFLRQMRKLDPSVKPAAKAAVEKVIDFYESGARTPGLGVKRLRGEVWEARAGLRIRVLYRLAGEELRFILAGESRRCEPVPGGDAMTGGKRSRPQGESSAGGLPVRDVGQNSSLKATAPVTPTW